MKPTSPSSSVAWWHSEGDPAVYATQRLPERVAGSALWAAFVLPLASRGCTRPLTSGLRVALGLYGLRPLAPRLAGVWLPAHPFPAAVIGVLGGLLEDYYCRLAWDDTMEAGGAVEPKMWTFRTLLPCAALLLHPLLAAKCLDGETKGADAALAQRQQRPLQVWPFFAVLDPAVVWPSGSVASEPTPPEPPEPPRCRYRSLGVPSSLAPSPLGAAALFIHLLGCRCGNGFFEVARHPENARWNVF